MADSYSSGWWQGSFPISGYTFSPTHLGTDFGLPSGTTLTAGMAGTVASGYTSEGGNWITVTGNGIKVYLGHLSQVLVPSGNVAAGTVLGYSGSTGDANGPHLHFQVNEGGSWLDPVKWLALNPGALVGRGGNRTGQTTSSTSSGNPFTDPFGFSTATTNVLKSISTDGKSFAIKTGAATGFFMLALILLIIGGLAIIMGPAKKTAETLAPIAASAIK